MNQATQLRREIIREVECLKALERIPSKDLCRSLHAPAVELVRRRSHAWVRCAYPKYERFFANGSDVRPARIAPVLAPVEEPWQVDLFRLARLTWSLPFTKGFGRRLKFLILDGANGKLMGLLGLQSPPLDLPARDRLFAYPHEGKVERVNQTMDIYTLGAVPPYGRLLGGKLVALAAASDEVRGCYRLKYHNRLTQMDQVRLPSHLIALTSTSAFGRSSLYNRLKCRERWIARSIGFTEGYGSFHLARLYPLMRQLLEAKGISTRGGFGAGPKIVWQTCARALDQLDLPRHLLKHGIRREVFLFPLIQNLDAYMAGETNVPCYFHQPFEELAAWWKERWLLPRAERVDGWHQWDHRQVGQLLQAEGR